MTRTFAVAPWPPLLVGMSAFSSLLLVGVGFAASRAIPSQLGAAHLVGSLVAWVPPAIAAGALLFVVRGYELDRDELRVRRLLWETVIPLAGLREATREPDLLQGTRRVAGNGGMFSFTGTYQHPRLGRYRALLTDWRQSVALKLPDQVVVVSPADPTAFLDALRAWFPRARTA